jgi:hypothetical protein
MFNSTSPVRLFAKLAYVSLPIVALLALSSVRTGLPTTVQHNLADDKIHRLLDDATVTPHIIVAGDSRAEFNVVPALIEANTHQPAVNVAVSYGTLDEMYALLDVHHELNKHRTIIVSVSSYEINDSIIDDQQTDLQVISSEPLSVRKVRDIYNYANFLALFFLDHFKRFLHGQPLDDSRVTLQVLNDKGYVQNTGQSTELAANSYPWPAEPRTGGVKQATFERAIRDFGGTNDTVVLYIGPFSPATRPSINAGIGSALEDSFRAAIATAIKPYPNIHFVDFSASDTPALTDKMFADPIHMNTSGAPVFTKMLITALHGQHLLLGRGSL